MAAPLTLLNRVLLDTASWPVAKGRAQIALLKRVKAYRLDDEATVLLSKMAIGEESIEKLNICRSLARLPFGLMWIEFSSKVRDATLAEVLGSKLSKRVGGESTRLGFLLEGLSDTVWRATGFVEGHEQPEDPITVAAWLSHTVSTEGPLEFRSTCSEPVIRAEVEALHRNGWHAARVWGTIDELGSPTFVEGSEGCNAVDFAETWIPDFDLIYDGTPEEKIKKTREAFSAGIADGTIRFLVTVLAAMNALPIEEQVERTSGSLRVQGSIRPPLPTRVISINLPKRQKTPARVLAMLRRAARRRHDVCGHWRRVHTRQGIEMRWIHDHKRGDESLGHVDQMRKLTFHP